MKIALRFVKPEKESILTFVEACKIIQEKGYVHTFTFIVPEVLLDSLLKEVSGFGFTTQTRIRRLRGVFDKTIDCSLILSNIDESKKIDKALEHIYEQAPSENMELSSEVFDNRIVIQGALDPCDGYGAAAENLTLALNKIREVSFVPRFNGTTAHLADPIIKDLCRNTRLAKNYLYFLAPEVNTLNDNIIKPKNANKILLTMFETTRVPLAWPNRINQYTKLLVPCNFNKEVFEANGGIKIPVEVFKLGVRTDIYQYKQREICGDRPYRFLFLFANHSLDDPRKNGITVLKAFNSLFKNNKDVELIVKVSGTVPNTLKQYFSSNVKVISNRLSIQELRNYYYDTDCFLFPSRGEGYGMTPREAMATGMPVIISDFSALSDIADPSICYPIKPSKLVPAIYGKGESSRHNNGNPLFGEWAEISVDSLMEQMNHVFLNQEEGIKKGKKASEYINNFETTDHSAKHLIKVFESL